MWFQVEQLELEISEIRQVLADKQEQENAMLQVHYCQIRQIFSFLFGSVSTFVQNVTKLGRYFPLQILMRVEQEQKVTEDARMFAEQDAAAQRYAAQVLQVSHFSHSCCGCVIFSNTIDLIMFLQPPRAGKVRGSICDPG